VKKAVESISVERVHAAVLERLNSSIAETKIRQRAR
jgi:hypothetical protein